MRRLSRRVFYLRHFRPRIATNQTIRHFVKGTIDTQRRSVEQKWSRSPDKEEPAHRVPKVKPKLPRIVQRRLERELQTKETVAGQQRPAINDDKFEAVKKARVAAVEGKSGSQKRKAEDDIFERNSKALKTGQGIIDSSQQGRSKKTRRPKREPRRPLGITNFFNACYANAVLQSLDNVPELSEHFRAKALGTINEVANYAADEGADLERFGRTTRSNGQKRSNLRHMLKEHEKEM